jgi:hypothetical protein
VRCTHDRPITPSVVQSPLVIPGAPDITQGEQAEARIAAGNEAVIGT